MSFQKNYETGGLAPCRYKNTIESESKPTPTGVEWRGLNVAELAKSFGFAWQFAESLRGFRYEFH